MPHLRTLKTPEWRQFEVLVARIEQVLTGPNISVVSPDRVRSLITNRKREVDASIRTTVGSAEILVAIECRKRTARQDVTWIEQLGSKKQAIGAARTIAVASTGFSQDAIQTAAHYGVDLRVLSEVTDPEIQEWILPQSVVHVFKECDLFASPEVIFLQESGDAEIQNTQFAPSVHPDPNPDTKVFRGPNDEPLSLNDIWLRADATLGIFDRMPADDRNHRLVVTLRVADALRVQTRQGYRLVHSLKLPMTLRWKHEPIALKTARVVTYEHGGNDGSGPKQVRAEFESKQSPSANIRFGMQFVAGSSEATVDLQLLPGKK